MAAGARFRGFAWRPLGRREPVIADFDLTIEAGERVLIAGPSGAGKSTLLYALAGALGTTIAGEKSGDVEVDGRIGLLLQNPGDAVVAEHVGRDVAFGPENLGLSRDEIQSRVAAALEAVRMPYGSKHFTAALSGGELQRLALAGVLAMRPELFLLDEPTSMLDEGNATAVREAILESSAGSTLIVVEHQIGPWLEHVDRVIVLSGTGEIASDGPPASLGTTDLPGEVWMPGLPAPTPLDIPVELVAPRADPLGLSLDQVSVELRTRTLRGTETTQALSGFSARLDAGVTTFTGPSGAGKSTALAAFGGLVKPTSGTITPGVHRWRSPRLAEAIGWVPQNPEHGFLAHTVGEEIEKTSRRLGDTVDVGAILDVFGLGHLALANPYRLSGGEQRRLALAAALGHRPGVVLLDEPTVGQDRHTWAAVVGWFASAARAGVVVGVSTHDPLIPRDVDYALRAGESV
ncbi:MAG: ATP-binding cassette domain-containing protein [Actinomycetota bacterium]|nr:ATP-binding cassette domain-containing protein [Actinomycetota bacterium]